MTFQDQQHTDEEFATLLCQPLTEHQSPSETVSPADLRNLQAALKSYRAETLLWAERRSAAQPSLAARAHRQGRWAALPRWSMALVAVVTIAGGAVHVASSRAEVDEPAIVTDAAVERPNPADIAADNELLSSIDAELSYHAHSPVDSLDLRSREDGAAEGNASGVTD